VRWQHRDESGRGFELQRKRNWKNEEEECVSIFGREAKRGVSHYMPPIYIFFY